MKPPKSRTSGPSASGLAVRGAGAVAAGGVAAALVALSLATADPLPAQEPSRSADRSEARVRVVGELGGYTLLGGDFEEIGAGPGLGAALRARITPEFSLGAGVAHSWLAADRLASSFRVLSLHLEPRIRFAPGGALESLRPFLGLRAGYARWTATEASETLEAEVSAGGLQAAGLVGLAAPMGDGIHLELVAEAGYLAFGDARVDARVEGGEPVSTGPVPDSETDGILLGLRAALSAPLPWP